MHMNIKLENIGIVKDSSIKLDGLTVITGNNNSGKTTVGKVIYSLIDAVSNLSSKSQKDRTIYINNVLSEVQETLEMFRMPRRVNNELKSGIFKEGSAIYYLLYEFNFTPRGYFIREGNIDIEDFSHALRKELDEINVDEIDESSELVRYYSRFAVRNDDYDGLKNKLNKQIEKAISILEKMFEDLKRDPELIDYARESINQTLRVEFSKQIQPVIRNVENSRIEVSDNDTIMFAFNIADNNLVNDGNPVFSDVPYKKAFFIDNPFVLDSPPFRRIYVSHDIESNSILDYSRILPHEAKLSYALKGRRKTTVFEETVINHGLAEIKEKINEVISGDFEFNSDGDFYVKDGKKLHFTNLATGSKMFSILKMLVDKGEVDESTLLVLDEPEAHLHPSWQNKFAEIIVLLVKYLNTGILMKSHSPNFVLAIDAYMRKYDVINKTNYYQTNHLEDNLVEYKNVNDDLGQIYADFMQYLSEMKVLRDQYYYNLGENHAN